MICDQGHRMLFLFWPGLLQRSAWVTAAVDSLCRGSVAGSAISPVCWWPAFRVRCLKSGPLGERDKRLFSPLFSNFWHFPTCHAF